MSLEPQTQDSVPQSCHDLCYVPRSRSVKSLPTRVVVSTVPQSKTIGQNTHMGKLVIRPGSPLGRSVPIICVRVGFLHFPRLERGGGTPDIRFSSGTSHISALSRTKGIKDALRLRAGWLGRKYGASLACPSTKCCADARFGGTRPRRQELAE